MDRSQVSRTPLRTRLQQGLIVLLTVLALAACATTPVPYQSLPPILTQEQLERPYAKVGMLQVSRDRFGSVEDLSPDDYDWAYRSLREEAQKIGADAVILPEVRVNVTSYLLFPSSEIIATAVAVKFR